VVATIRAAITGEAKDHQLMGARATTSNNSPLTTRGAPKEFPAMAATPLIRTTGQAATKWAASSSRGEAAIRKGADSAAAVGSDDHGNYYVLS
jgi:hypothetical protein